MLIAYIVGTAVATMKEASLQGHRLLLARDPRHPAAHLGLARLLRTSDPRAALEHADLAASGDPNRLDALELRAWLRGSLGDPLAVADVDLLIRTPTPNRLGVS